MKIANNKADNFCQKPHHDIFYILLYGPDEGLSQARLEVLLNHYIPDRDTFLYTKISDDAVAKNPYILLEEALSYPFGGGTKIISSQHDNDKASAPIKQYLEGDSHANIIINICGNLPPKSTLRQLAEKHPKAASIAAYHDSESQISYLIDTILKADNITLEPDAQTYLRQELGEDRMNTMRELEKIQLYAKSQKHLTYDDVVHLIGYGTFDIDSLIACIFGGKKQEFTRSFAKIDRENINATYIIRQLLYYLARLSEAVSIQQAQHCSAKQALEALTPKIFFKSIGMMQDHLNLWNYAKISQAHTILLRIEEELKSNSYDDRLILSRGCLRLMALSHKK